MGLFNFFQRKSNPSANSNCKEENGFYFEDANEFMIYAKFHSGDKRVDWLSGDDYLNEFKKGYIFFEQGQFKKAAEAFKQCLVLNPIGIKARFELSETYIQMRKFNDAKESLLDMKDYLIKDSDIAKFYRRLGFIECEKSNFQCAIACYFYSQKFENSPIIFNEILYIINKIDEHVDVTNPIAILERHNIPIFKEPLRKEDMTSEDDPVIKQIREENEEYKRKRSIKLEKLSEIVQIDYPTFNFSEENKNSLFSQLMDLDVDMKTAYEIVHKDDLLKKVLLFRRDSTVEAAISANYFYQILSDFYELDSDENTPKTDAELAVEAADSGLEVEQYIEVEKLKQMEKDKKKTSCQQWAKDAVDVIKEYSFFDLKKELANYKFVQLIEHDINMKTAFEVIHREELFIASRL